MAISDGDAITVCENSPGISKRTHSLRYILKRYMHTNEYGRCVFRTTPGLADRLIRMELETKDEITLDFNGPIDKRLVSWLTSCLIPAGFKTGRIVPTSTMLRITKL